MWAGFGCEVWVLGRNIKAKIENIRILVSQYLARLLGLLLELLNGPLVDSTALVDQMTGGGGLA